MDPPIENALPVCPHCGEDPAMISSRPAEIGNLRVLLVFCGNMSCRKIFTVEVIGIVEPRIADAGRIYRGS